ncbi:mitochondrial chaperone BCS1 [Seiridium cupressi]
MVSFNALTHHLDAMASPSGSPLTGSTTSTAPGGAETTQQIPQLAVLDFFFPGFSMFAGAVQKYLHIDLNLYFSVIAFFGVLIVIWNYTSSFLWERVETHFMSSVDIRTDDEIYNILMTWVANQSFSQSARRFVVNADLSSRAWYLRRWDYDSDDEESGDESGEAAKKALNYTPSFGTHYFWYKGRLLLFKRNSKEQKNNFLSVSEREEISVCCFGRNPWIIKKLLHEARVIYNKKDQAKTLIYRGTTRSGSTEPTWQRCLARNSRPFSTVILNEKTKTDLIEDVTDYLHPATQRWYSNRGIPYRRGYLLYGPPGTGKSSLSLALAGFFKMRIYIVSLSSVTSSEENLISLFAELPRRCVVLLEDIDTAGLTHTREEGKQNTETPSSEEALQPGQLTPGSGNTNGNKEANPGRLSLSGLLNILDGVASQEGRVLIMTTNHVDKLDKALIRPGRVDMIVEFGRADAEMTAAIFRAIFARLEADAASTKVAEADKLLDPEMLKKQAKEKALLQKEEDARIEAMALEFASRIPTHEFSPAELQGHLLRHKRDPRAAVDKSEEFVEQTRKDRKDKELKEAEERRKSEEKKAKEAAKKEKREQKKATKKEARKAKRKEPKSSTPGSDSDASSSSSDESSDAEAKSTKDSKKKKSKDSKRGKNKKTPKPSDPDSSSSLSDSSSSDAEPEQVMDTKESTGPQTLVVQADAKISKSKHEKRDSGYGTPTSVEV